MSILGCGWLGWSRRVEWCRRSKQEQERGPKRAGRKERAEKSGPKRAGRKERPEEIGRASRAPDSVFATSLSSVVFGSLFSARCLRSALLGPFFSVRSLALP